MFVSGNGIEADAIDIVDRSSKPNGPSYMGRTCLKFVEKPIVKSLLERNRLDHVSASLARRHGIEQCMLAVQYSDTCWAINFVARESVEIAIERAHIHFAVKNGLSAIDQHRHVPVMGHLHNLPDWIDCSKNIGDMDNR